MCGITGIVNLGAGPAIAHDIIAAMTRTLSHRGPDEEGIHVDEHFAMGHRRLRIIDLETGKQPMSTPDRSIWVTYNGEIYNYRELRRSLEWSGTRFRTRSDTEVLLAAYVAGGIACVHRFNGMFAFALADCRTRQFYLVRDRLGIKPLYYTFHENLLIFGSEIKAILAYPEIDRHAEPSAVGSYLSFRYALDPQTLYKGIYSLPPGHHLTVTDSRISIAPYWELPMPEPGKDRGEAFYLDQFAEHFHRAVSYRRISDVPVGAFLSGGLDSTAIVARMTESAVGKVDTYSVGFSPADTNEFEFARLAADCFNTCHHEIVLDDRDYFDLLPRVMAYKDAPLSVPNEVAIYQLAAEMKKKITVVLSGEGADELLAGYGRIMSSTWDYRRLKKMACDPTFFSDAERASFLEAIREKYGPHRPQSPKDHFLASYDYFKPENKAFLLRPEYAAAMGEGDPADEQMARCFDQVKSFDLRSQFLWVLQNLHLPGLLLRLDNATMACGVEARVPFVDHELVEFMMSVPVYYKLRWRSDKHRRLAHVLNSDQISEVHDITKYLLRRAFATTIPEPILKRRKVGFPVPLEHWFGNSFNGLAREILLDPVTHSRGIWRRDALEAWLAGGAGPGGGNWGLQTWMMVNLELWFRNCVDV